jgi:GT2 family glycosyltransferase
VNDTPLQPVLTVVIVSWNGRHLLDDCLGGVAQQDLGRHRFDVLVVDNASTDGTLEHLARNHPDVRVLTAPYNTGFAGGAHRALAEVSTPYSVMLNNDAVPEPGFLSALLRAIEAPGADRVAAVTGKVLLRPRFRRLPPGAPPAEGDVVAPSGTYRPAPDGDVDLINSTGNEVTRSGYGRDRGWLQPDGDREPPAEVFGFCGAAVLLRTAALSQVGNFDPRLFLYYEDTDLSWRLRTAGWTIRYEPAAVVRHQHAASSDVRSALFRFHDDRNRLLVLARNAPGRLAVRAALRYPVTVLHLTLRRGPTAAMTVTRLRAFRSYLRWLPSAVRARRASGRSALVPRAQTAALLVPD